MIFFTKQYVCTSHTEYVQQHNVLSGTLWLVTTHVGYVFRVLQMHTKREQIKKNEK